ncbi:MAG: hypothetical protein CMH83_23440 [Nocardioides sp.]|nr:hypothetical protein [Nocardioides sp.]
MTDDDATRETHEQHEQHEQHEHRGRGGLGALGRLAGARPSRSQVVVAVLLALVGFAAVTQIRTAEDDTSYSALREQDLIDVLSGLSGTSQRTQAEIARLRQARDELQSESSRRRAAVEQAQGEVDDLQVLAGLVPVTGPGIRVTITEETGTVTVSSMLDLVQDLRTVGAEAMQVNGTARIVADTSVEAAIGGLVIDGQLVESPYVVDAIGVSNTLARAVEFGLGPRQQLEADGASVEVEELASLDIESVRKQETLQYAEPAS